MTYRVYRILQKRRGRSFSCYNACVSPLHVGKLDTVVLPYPKQNIDLQYPIYRTPFSRWLGRCRSVRRSEDEGFHRINAREEGYGRGTVRLGVATVIEEYLR